MRALSWRAVWLVGGVASFQACSGHSTSGRDSEAGGTGGVGSKTSDAGRGGSSGAEHAGRSGGPGRGGVGGVYGGREGRSGDAGAGEGGAAGQPGGPITQPPNPSCNCTALDVDEDGYDYACTQSLAAHTPTVAPGSLCHYPGPAVSRTTCEDGSFLYRWTEGGENSYELELDRDGHTLYYSARGFVEECGFNESGNQLVRLAVGEPSASCASGTACNPCGNDGGIPGLLPLCIDCGDASDAGQASLSLGDYCEEFHCPTDLAAVLGNAGTTCTLTETVTLREGCGFVAIEAEVGFSSEALYFDDAGTLVGALRSGDVPFGQCNVGSYQGGAVPQTCATARTCSLCGGNGSAGAAGEGGQAGVGNASELCTPP